MHLVWPVAHTKGAHPCERCGDGRVVAAAHGPKDLLKRKHQGYGDTFFIGEVFVKINGKQQYL